MAERSPSVALFVLYGGPGKLEPLKWWELQTACRNGLYSVTDWSVCLSWFGILHLTEDRDICSYPSAHGGLPWTAFFYYSPCHLAPGSFVQLLSQDILKLKKKCTVAKFAFKYWRSLCLKPVYSLRSETKNKDVHYWFTKDNLDFGSLFLENKGLRNVDNQWRDILVFQSSFICSPTIFKISSHEKEKETHFEKDVVPILIVDINSERLYGVSHMVIHVINLLVLEQECHWMMLYFLKVHKSWVDKPR